MKMQRLLISILSVLAACFAAQASSSDGGSTAAAIRQAAPVEASPPHSRTLRICEAGEPQLTPLPNDEGYFVAQVRDLTPESIQTLGLSLPHAVLALQVAAGGPAAEAGLKPADVILALDGTYGLPVYGFIEAVHKKKPGDTIRVEILRKGERQTLTATLVGIVAAAKLELKGTSMELGLAAEEAVAENFPRDKFPAEWAIAKYTGGTYAARLVDTPVDENWERATAAYEAALAVPELKAHAEEWTLAQERLGDTYSIRIRGDQLDNNERAVQAYEAALSHPSAKARPKRWAKLQLKLGQAYNRLKKSEEAIKAFEAALTVYKSKDDWTDWITVKAYLGRTYMERTKGDPAENNELAIKAFEDATALPAAKDWPQWWARLQYDLGVAYEKRTVGKKTQNLKRASRAYDAALTIFTKDAYPAEHADAEERKAKALARLPPGAYRP